jgi:DnaJ-class molecular chaperone
MTDYLDELFGGGLTEAETIAMNARMAIEVALEKVRISNLKAEMATKTSAPRCSRCGGTGRLSQFMHRNNGVCFGCGGSGNA